MDKDYLYDCETNSTIVYRNKYTGREIHIPKEEITNGEIIKNIFPNGTESLGRKKIYYSFYPNGKMEFTIDWWNTPYDYERS